MLNLVSNAMKFTYQGYVKISLASLDANTIQIKVKDTGIGMNSD